MLTLDEEALFTYTNPKSDIAINQQNKYAYNYTNAISLEWKPVKGIGASYRSHS